MHGFIERAVDSGRLADASVLAADQKITWWARQLRAAGVAGGMDVLRARAAIDLLLNYGTRPPATSPASGSGT